MHQAAEVQGRLPPVMFGVILPQMGGGLEAGVAPETGLELRPWVRVWALGTFVAIAALPVYLPSSLLTGLGSLAAEPWPLTALVVLGAAASWAGVLVVRGRVLPLLRRTMVTGAVLASLGCVGWVGYVEVLSHQLAGDRAPQVGDLAPDFALVDPEGRAWQLSAFRGGPVVLLFYRAHW